MTRRLSLTVRLTVLFSLSSAVVLLGLGVLIWLAMDRHFATEDYVNLRGNLRLIEKVARETPAGQLPARLGEMVGHHPGFVAQVRAADGTVLYDSGGFDFARAAAAAGVAAPDAAGEQRFAWRDGERAYRGLRTRLALPASTAGPLTVVAALDTEIHGHFMHAFGRSLGLYIALAVFASGLLGWWAARRGLQPLRMMASRARGVTANRLDARMPVEAVPVEMGDLAATLNAMLDRLQAAFQRLSEFSSDLAHELRTPITNLLTQTQVVLSRPRDDDKYREVLASNAEELQRLGRMVSEMLDLAKMEHGITLPSEAVIQVDDEVRALFDFYDALAEDQGVTLRVAGTGTIVGDRLMLRRALSNVLSNAIRHTPAGGQVRVEIGEPAGRTEIAVENDGDPIDPAALPLLFDRFYREDKSRTRAGSERTGLGLAITKAIMDAHGGTIAATSAAGRTRFTLVFPGR